MTWKEFRQLVNKHVQKISGGLGLHDLGDVCFYDYWPGPDGDDREALEDYNWEALADEAAVYVLEENGFPFDEE